MEANEGRELGWDDVISKDDSFIQIEPGDYDFTIDHYDRSRSQGSDKMPACAMAVVYFNIHTEGEPQIRENFIMHSKFEWKLSQLFASVGLKKKGEDLRMDWNKLPGLTGRCKVTLDPDKNDPEKKYNHIKTLYPKEPKQFKAGSF